MSKISNSDALIGGVVRLRNQLGLSQKEFADKLGLSKYSVIHWENKQNEITYENLILICDKCECSLDYLFQRTDILNAEKIITEKITEISAEKAYKHIFNIEFPLIEEKDVDPMYFLNITTNKYILEFFHYEKLLEQKKEQDQITQEVFDFELEKLKEKYSKAFSQELSEKVKYNCTRIDED